MVGGMPARLKTETISAMASRSHSRVEVAIHRIVWLVRCFGFDSAVIFAHLVKDVAHILRAQHMLSHPLLERGFVVHII